MNKKLKKGLGIILAFSIGIMAFAGCSSANSATQGQSSAETTKGNVESEDQTAKNIKTLDTYKTNGKITVGTNAQFPPFEYYESGEVTGFDIEFSKKIAEKLGVELVIEDMSFEGLINALNAGKIDFIAAGMTADDTRKKSVDFSEGYYNSTQAIIVMKDNTDIKGKSDLANKKIGVQIGTTGSQEAKNIEGTKVSEYNNGAEAIMDLKNKKLDAVVLDLEPSKEFAKQNDDISVLDEALTKEEYSIAVRKGETELAATINEVLSEMKENGEYDTLFKKYFEE